MGEILTTLVRCGKRRGSTFTGETGRAGEVRSDAGEINALTSRIERERSLDTPNPLTFRVVVAERTKGLTLNGRHY